MNVPIIAAMNDVDKLFASAGSLSGDDLVAEFAKVERDHGYMIAREALLRCHQIAATRLRHIDDAHLAGKLT